MRLDAKVNFTIIEKREKFSFQKDDAIYYLSNEPKLVLPIFLVISLFS